MRRIRLTREEYESMKEFDSEVMYIIEDTIIGTITFNKQDKTEPFIYG